MRVSTSVETMTGTEKISGAAGLEKPDPESAFELLVAEHQRQVYSMALRLTGNAAAADDITQETFISAWRHLGRFRGESSLKTWLFRIAANKVRSYWRWRKLRSWVGLSDRDEEKGGAALEDLLPDDPSGRPEQASQAAELERRVQAAINALPPRQREVAVLRSQGLALAEIGEALGMAEGTVKAHWFEARKKLAASLGEYL